MEIIYELAISFWQWTIVIALILIGFIANLFDKFSGKRIDFEYEDYPHMQPIRIATKDKGFWGAILMWLLGTRKWRITQNFNYKIRGQEYVIPRGFEFDGASVPKFLATFLSPVGVLLIGGLIHDYAYKYEQLLEKNQPLVSDESKKLTQKEADIIFRDINIEVNGFHFLNYLAYWALRIGGFVAWNGHRKRNVKIGD